MKKHKENLKYIIIAMSLTIAIVIGSIFIFRTIDTASSEDQSIALATKQQADKLFEMAVEAFDEDAYSKANGLYKAALKQYEYLYTNAQNITDSQHAQMRIFDCETQLKLVEYERNQ